MITAFAGIMLIGASLQSFNDYTGTAVAQPIGEAHLDPTSGSYYQIFVFHGKPPHTWRHARKMVRGYFHEKREGRLAHVLNIKTHYFLISKFPMMFDQRMWIGLSVVCEKDDGPQPQWTDGKLLKETTFRAWDPAAGQSYNRQCKGKDYKTQIPVMYDPTQFGSRWRVEQINTNVKYMMVEFAEPVESE